MPAIDAFVYRNRGTHRELAKEETIRLLEAAARRDGHAIRESASRLRLSEFGVARINETELLAGVVSRIERGELVGIRKAETSQAITLEGMAKRRLAEEFQALAGGDIVVRGERYKLLADFDLDRFPDRRAFEVVRRADAERVLDALAKTPGTSRRLGERVAEARGRLTQDWRQPFQPDGLVMLRRCPIARIAKVVEGPTYTPSELKALADKERPRLHTFEVVAYDSFGQPLPGVRLDLAVDGAKRTVTTDGSGRARYEEASDETATARIADPGQVQKLLVPRWSQPPKQTDAAAIASAAPIALGKEMPAIELAADIPTKIVFLRRVLRVRLVGMFFDHSKCLLLPGALDGIRRLVEIYAQHPEANLLIVGHTDTRHSKISNDEGANFNRRLSLERAKAVGAYLTDDVDAWHRWYKVEGERRWGAQEDLYMLEHAASPDGPTSDGNGDSKTQAKSFQQEHGLPTTGNIGELTRRALIQNYMSADGTTLPDGVTITTHGCGPYFPDVESGPNEDVPKNRRVEMFVFDGPIVPPPPGDYSEPGSPAYQAWVAQVQETIDFEGGAVTRQKTQFRLCDDELNPHRTKSFLLQMEGCAPIQGTTGDDGVAEVDIPETATTGEIRLFLWPSRPNLFITKKLVFQPLQPASTPDGAAARLKNLNYAPVDEGDSDAGLRSALQYFQSDWDGLSVTGDLDPGTSSKLRAIHDEYKTEA